MANLYINDTIQHDGEVRKADANSVTVRITSLSACSGCHAEGSCTISGKEEKLIEISGRYNVTVGDIVTVIMKKSMGYVAILLGYFLPLFILLIILIILNLFSVPELTAGLFSLAMLIPYYAFLYLFRRKIDKKFTFSIKT